VSHDQFFHHDHDRAALFDVPLKGDGLTLTLGALLCGGGHRYGLFILDLHVEPGRSGVRRSGACRCYRPCEFSGMMQPVSTLEGGARSWVPVADELLPAYECRRVHRGLGFTDMATDLLALTCFPAFLLLSALLCANRKIR
jgi:ribosome-dependent ATPase